jgi:hypothetical protein
MAVSAPIAIVDYESTASQTVHSKAVGTTVAAGTFVVVCAISSARTATTFTVSDSQGNTWTLGGGPYPSATTGNTSTAQVAWATLGGSGWAATDTVTITTDVAGGADFMVFSLTGVDTTTPVDVAASAASGTGTAWAAPAVTGASGDLVLATGGIGGSGATLTPGSGFTLYLRAAGSGTNPRAMATVYAAGTGASLTPSGTISASNPWVGVSLSFKAAVTNAAPTANAGPDQTNIAAGATVTLDGSGSSDSDGTIASYAWTQTAGTTVTPSSTSAAQPTFTAPSTGSAQTLTFSLVVTDNLGATSTADTVNIGVLAAPPASNLKLRVGGVFVAAVEKVRIGGVLTAVTETILHAVGDLSVYSDTYADTY